MLYLFLMFQGMVSPDHPVEGPSVGRRLEGLVFEDEDKSHTNGTAAGLASPSQGTGVPLCEYIIPHMSIYE